MEITERSPSIMGELHWLIQESEMMTGKIT